MKVLIVEDHRPSALYLEEIVKNFGYVTQLAENGEIAFSQLLKDSFDIVLTDWLMPNMDGIELLRRIREHIVPVPILVVITSLNTPGAHSHALEAGADAFLGKPFSNDQIHSCILNCIKRRDQPLPSRPSHRATTKTSAAPLVGVAIVGSTGGPSAMKKIFQSLTPTAEAVFYVVQNGPQWMVKAFQEFLQRNTSWTIRIAEDQQPSEPSRVYIAPNAKHLCVEPKTLKLLLNDDPPENYLRPSADPLFRSVSDAFGSKGIGIVLTGFGRDGALGAGQILENGGSVFVQDPDTCVSKSMPQTVIDLNFASSVLTLDEIPGVLARHIRELALT